MINLELNYSKQNGAFYVQNAPKYPELPYQAKVVHSKYERPFQVILQMEGKDKIAMVHPKFI
jgi:hypothetical protein